MKKSMSLLVKSCARVHREHRRLIGYGYAPIFALMFGAAVVLACVLVCLNPELSTNAVVVLGLLIIVIALMLALSWLASHRSDDD